MATIHPAAILRAPDEESRRRERGAFADDLRKAERALARLRAAAQ
jgi:uracil-DNA glycosylase